MLHKQLCDCCAESKPTGLTEELGRRWHLRPDQQSAIERSVTTLTTTHDFWLLHTGVCYECHTLKGGVKQPDSEVRYED